MTDQFVWLILYSFFDIFVRKKTSIYFYFVWIRRALMLDQSKQRNVFFSKVEAWFSGYSGFVLGRKLNHLLGRILGLSWSLSLEVQLYWLCVRMRLQPKWDSLWKEKWLAQWRWCKICNLGRFQLQLFVGCDFQWAMWASWRNLSSVILLRIMNTSFLLIINCSY